jgi:hypothetical protein
LFRHDQKKAFAVPFLTLELVKYSLFDRSPILQMLDNDSFQQVGRDVGVPDPIRIHDDDRSIAADAEAWRFSPLHAIRTKEKIFALQ